MKLSNKILIAFALALILIPVLGMVIVSATKYKTGDNKHIMSHLDSFSATSKNMTSIPLSSSFESVNIADAKALQLNIHFVKDSKYGVKIPSHLKDVLSVNVDASGTLQIVVKNNTNNEGYYTTIAVYSPSIKSLNVAKANDVNVSAIADSLSLNIQKSGSVSFDHATKINQLSVKTEDLASLYFREAKIKSISLDLHNTNLKSELNSFDNVSIATFGKCKVELIGSYDQIERKYTINNLTLNTNGIADVKLENIKVANCSGKLSNETLVQMPAVNLNQMFNKK
ncbi:hypothetical protein FA048_04910 [Pedobacter polaris]|uniref:Putative auto-transporter adhesin head GIN domain-containing protein n=1 Tax=Pedobacter polaris TaxID=2571273 RepID=A0A4U1CUU3_9SPHI|nr:DUF2807 domain-containing protein [Pedobacter polaris]TKC12961.1 hypothetical protein FA048_04910 [Pedobacter polaris]